MVGVNVSVAVGGINTVVATVGVMVDVVKVLVGEMVGVWVGFVSSFPTCRTTNPRQ